jgi:EpsI family protein
VYCMRWIRLGRISTSLIWVFAVIIIILSGITYRVLASRLKYVAETPVNLTFPLSNFPKQVGNWVGDELPIPNITKEYMERYFADDFLSRRYINETTNAWADVYIVYCSSQPGGIIGHQPQVCYPAHGWIHDNTEPSQFISQAGQQIPCLIHRFHKPAPFYDQIVVMSFYILNGQLTTNENDFSGLLGRRPNIAGNPARYVAQVQVSSVLENSIRNIATDMADLVLDYLPDENGKVKATEYISTSSNVLK